MECSNPGPPGEGVPSELNDVGHIVPRGHSHMNSFNVPPRFWGPPPQFHGFGPRPFQFPPGPLFGCGPPMFNVPPPSYSSHMNASGVFSPKINDETWIKNWLESKSFKKHGRETVSKSISLSETQEKIRQWKQSLERLEMIKMSLKDGIDTLSEEEWNVRWSSVERSKADISDMVTSSFDEKPLLDLQKKLAKRMKKRSRLKRQHAERRKDAYLAQLRRQHLHQKADAWLAEMQQAVDRTRKEEELKKEADSVLAEVTRHKSEGRRQISLLEALQKLHNARLQTVEARGSKLSDEDKKNIAHSAQMFDHLLNLWSRKMEDYDKEEHRLRVMLDESAAKQSDLEIENVQRILEEWESFLFGSENNSASDELCDIDTLVSIRYAWDQYLVPDGVVVPMASAIPVGWVLPTIPSSSDWQKLIESE